MNPERFAYWLQGFAELHQEPPTPEQWQSIKEHLALAFKKETPPINKIDAMLQKLPTYKNENTLLAPNVDGGLGKPIITC